MKMLCKMRPTSTIAILFAALTAIVLVDAAACLAQSRVEVEAAVGEPFGVGRITVGTPGDFRVNLPIAPGDGPPRKRIANIAKRVLDKAGAPRETMSLETTEMSLVERGGRIFYPVFEKIDRPIAREFVNLPQQTTVYFLFQGNEPLSLTLYAPQPQTGQVVPRRDPQLHSRLLAAWWRDYSAATDGRNTAQDFSPIVEEYLVDTLSRRLRLQLPQRPAASETSVFRRELNLLAGTEQARQEAARAVLTAAPARPADEPLPEELPQPRPEVLNPAEAETEPLASHVPVECFYIRFGSFTNFLWMRHRLEDWGGELRDIISERGLNYGLNEKMQRQLILRESAAAKMFGDKVIADVALIGTDTFLREGAAIGVMFQAHNSAALTADFTQQRAAAVKGAKGAKQENLKIDGRPVSYISTPDGALRSYYAIDGDFHLITTSRKIVEWFLAVGAGDHESVGSTEDFRLARKHMPLSRADTVFAYFSSAFFRNLLGAPYQIEANRRMRAAVEIELVRVARLAARGEGHPVESIEELVAGGYLPEGFGRRADGSHLVVDGASISDSLRGGLGSFLPVPDVNVNRVTSEELTDYKQLADTYTAVWGQMDPIVAAIRREELSDKKFERVSIDAMVPLSERHARILDAWLGPPTDQRLAPVEGDVVAIEAVLRGGTFFSGGDHHLFGALRNADPSIALNPGAGLVPRLISLQFGGIDGYLGAWPNPGFLRLLGGVVETPVDANGYSRSLSGIWRRQFDDFTLLALAPETLPTVSPQLRFEKAPRPAQIWLRADDLATSTLAPLINAYGYRQSRQIALGNTRYLNMLVEQLHVPAAEALSTAELLLSAKLLDPLGGKYELQNVFDVQKAWVSTSLVGPARSPQPPGDYTFPALQWLRGVNLELVNDRGLVTVHGEATMPVVTPTTSGFELPKFPFSLPTAPSKQEPSKPAAKAKAPEPLPAPAKADTKKPNF